MNTNTTTAAPEDEPDRTNDPELLERRLLEEILSDRAKHRFMQEEVNQARAAAKAAKRKIPNPMKQALKKLNHPVLAVSLYLIVIGSVLIVTSFSAGLVLGGLTRVFAIGWRLVN